MNKIIATADGSHSLLSDAFGVAYHSKHGAIQETLHVFIQHGLRHKAAKNSDIAVLDIGFGTGLNAFMTLLETTLGRLNIEYTGVEAYPIDMEIANALNYATLLDSGAENALLFKKMHEASWGNAIALTPHFAFTKILTQFQLLTFENTFDVVYFDAFAPAAQAELWTLEMMQRMYAALRPDGVLTTYCAKGEVKRNLKAAGFKVEALPGPVGKREMTRATK